MSTSYLPADPRSAQGKHRARLLLAGAILVPLLLFAALFLLPATRKMAAENVVLAAIVLTAVLLAAVLAVGVAMRRQRRRSEAALEQERGAWAAACGWQYRPEKREIPPDALSEVHPTVTRPVPVQFEANGTWRGRRALLQSRDTWVWIRASLRSSRRTVVGVQARIELPRIVLVTDVNQVAANLVSPQPAKGLSRIPHPAGTRTALWTPQGLEGVIFGVLQPMLLELDQGVGATQITVVCSGQWVLISAEFDADDATVERRLDTAVQMAETLEHGALTGRSVRPGAPPPGGTPRPGR